MSDGLSNTLIIFENADVPNVWINGVLTTNNLNNPQTINHSNHGGWANPNNNNVRGWDVTGTVQFGTYIVNKRNGAALYGFHPPARMPSSATARSGSSTKTLPPRPSSGSSVSKKATSISRSNL